MRIGALVLFLMTMLCGYSSAQIKVIYDDDKVANRSNVEKSNGMDDLQILDEQFGDAQAGKVVRIYAKEPKPPKPERVKPEREEKEQAPKEKVVEQKKVEQPKPEKVVQEKVVQERSFAGTTSSRVRHKKKKRFFKFKLQKRKRSNRKNLNSCYHF